MATSQSIDSSTPSLLVSSPYHGVSSLHSQDYTQSLSNKKGQSSSTQGAYTAGQANNGGSNTGRKSRGDSVSNSHQTHSSNYSTAAISYPYLQTYCPQIFQTINNPMTASLYQSGGISSQQVNNTSTSVASSQTSNRRGGKKKAPLQQQIQCDIRIFFNLRKKETSGTHTKGPSQMYKLKNPPSISEWYFLLFLNLIVCFRFKKLLVEERVNALSTLHPLLTSALVNMSKKFETSRRSSYSFAMRESISGISSFGYSYNSQSPINFFDDHFYCREWNDIEISHNLQTQNDKERFEAEQEIIKNIRFSDSRSPLDTLTVTQELVQDPDYFFKLMSYISKNDAFKSPCSFQFDQKTQSNYIESPSWFKPKSFHSFSTWIGVALEENLWAHYNFDNNQNMGTAKANEMNQIFKDRIELSGAEVPIDQLATFWQQMGPKTKKDLQEQLRQKANQIKNTSSHFFKQTNARDFNMTCSIIEKNPDSLGNSNISVSQDDSIGNSGMGSGTSDQELKLIIDMSNVPGKETEMLDFLVYTPIYRAEKRQDALCREFYKLITQQYQEDLMENLLQEEMKSKKKKKKKNQSMTQKEKESNSQTITDQSGSQVENTDTSLSLDDQQMKNKKKNKKNKNGNINNQKAQKSMNTSSNIKNYNSTLDEPTTNNFKIVELPALEQDSKQKKKKRQQNMKNHQTSNVNGNGQQQRGKNNQNKSLNSAQESHSCDEQPIGKEIPIIERDNLKTDEKSSSCGITSVTNFNDNTTTNQSHSNSSSTIKSQHQHEVHSDQSNYLMLSQSKSLDHNYIALSSQNSKSLTNKLSQKAGEKNLVILKNQSSSSPLQSNKMIFSDDEYMLKREESNQTNSDQQVQSIKKGIEDYSLINKYVLQLTNEIIEEVCYKIESESNNQEQSMKQEKEEVKQQSSKQSKFTKEFYSIGAIEGDNSESTTEQQEQALITKIRKCSFKKKHRKESNQQQEILNSSSSQTNIVGNEQHIRKTSFSKKIKDEKKYSEDMMETQPNYYLRQQQKQSQDQISQKSYEAEQSSSTNQHKQGQGHNNNHGRNMRKGFQKNNNNGIGGQEQKKQHPKKHHNEYQSQQEQNVSKSVNQEWAKGVAKQPDPFVKNHGQTIERAHDNKTNISQQQVVDDNQISETSSVKNSVTEGEVNKKKRNRKKGKVDNTELMNDFMKKLQSNSEDTTGVLTEPDFKSTKSTQQNHIKSKPPHHQQNNNGNQQKNNSSQNVNEFKSQKEQQQPNKSNNTSKQQSQQLSKNNSQQEIKTQQKPQQQQTQDNQQKGNKQFKIQHTSSVKSEQNAPIQKQNQIPQLQQTNSNPQQTTSNYQQKPYNKQNHQHAKGGQNYNNNNGNYNKKSYHYQHRPNNNHQQYDKFDDAKSVNSNVAETMSENGAYQSFNPQQQTSQSHYIPKYKYKQNNNNNNLSQKHQNSFKMINFQPGNDWETTSITDLTATSNNAADDTSLEHQQEEIKLQQNDLPFIPQPQIQIPQDYSLPQVADLNLQSYKSHQIQIEDQTFGGNQIPIYNEFIPPHIQSPESVQSNSTLSTHAQCFTPKNHQYNSNHHHNSQYGPANNNNYYSNNQGRRMTQNLNSGANCINGGEYQQQKTGYQSFQNTPLKQGGFQQNNNTTKYQQKQSNNHNSNTEQAPHFKTPPQMAKKQCSTSSNFSLGGGYGGPNNQGGYKRQNNPSYNQAPPSQPGSTKNANGQRLPFRTQQSQQYYNNKYQPIQSQVNVNNFQLDYQVPPLQQNHSTQTQQQQQQYWNYNNYYQQQDYSNMPTTHNQFSSYTPEGIFHYQEQQQQQQQLTNNVQPFVPQSQSQQYPNTFFNQNNYDQTINGTTVGGQAYNSLQQEQLNGLFEQGTDFIQYIFNSLNPASQPMSPIPPTHLMSPPPLIDQQYHLENELQQLAMNMDPNAYQLQESQFYTKFDQEIFKFCNQIKENLDKFKPERDFVYNKISNLCQQIYPNEKPQLVLFGSLSTGLALESSDMDLAVTGLNIDDRFIMIVEMQKLAEALQDWNCLASFKSIDTASIPVIKLQVDLQKLRETQPEIQNTLPIPQEQNLLHVDITFNDSNGSYEVNLSSTGQIMSDLGNFSQCKTHLGLQSCSLVSKYIQEYPYLREVAILLKKFLALHNFNSPYYGGISSYSTVILLVAYMNHYDLRKFSTGLTPSRLLMGFLDYYGNYFNPKFMGVSVYNNGSFFSLSNLLNSNIVILDPLNLQNNTTKNSYHTQEILMKFQCVFNNLKNLMFKLPQLQNKSILKGVFDSAFKEKSSPQHSEKSQTAGSLEILQDTVAKNENHLRKDQQLKVNEEIEVSQPEDGSLNGQQQEVHPFAKVNFLEIFFAKEAQPITNQRENSAGLDEPKCTTQITQISLTEALADTVV